MRFQSIVISFHIFLHFKIVFFPFYFNQKGKKSHSSQLTSSIINILAAKHIVLDLNTSIFWFARRNSIILERNKKGANLFIRKDSFRSREGIIIAEKEIVDCRLMQIIINKISTNHFHNRFNASYSLSLSPNI